MEDSLRGNVQRTMLRCRRCRKGVVDSTCLLTIPPTDEGTADVCSIWHVNVDTLPEWILTSVHQAQWTAGKLNCQNCGARLGGFNFINRSECPCGNDTSIHFSKSRLDYDDKHPVLIFQPLRSRLERGQAGLVTDISQNKEERPDFNRTALDSFQISSAAARPHMSPAGASNPQTEGKTLTGEGGVWKRLPTSGCRVFCPAVGSVRSGMDECTLSPVSYPRSQHLHTDDEASSTCHSSVSGGTQSPLDQQMLQNEEDVESFVETAVLHEEASDTALFLRRRSVSDGVSDREEEAVPRATMGSPASNSRTKREKNRLKSLRRKQRRRERWLQRQQENELAESVRGSLLDSEDEDEEEEQDTEGLTCAVCLDVYFSPYSCEPCGHVFCEPCLRTHAKNKESYTPCPLCRRIILNASSHQELKQRAETLFPKLYSARKQDFRTSPCANWPLPSHRERRQYSHHYSFRDISDDEELTVIHFYISESSPMVYEVWMVLGYICSFRGFLVLMFLWLIMYFLF